MGRWVRGCMSAMVVAGLVTLSGCGGGDSSRTTSPSLATALKANISGEFTAHGVYWNPQEPGTGFFFQGEGSMGTATFFVYEADGRPVWYAGSGSLQSDGVGGHRYEGVLNRFAWGKPAFLAMTYADSQQVKATDVGRVTIDFRDDRATVKLPRRTMQAQRFVRGSGPSGSQPETGVYFDPAQAGRGFTVEVDGDVATVGVYDYDLNLEPTWSLGTVRLGRQSNPVTGDLMSYRGGQTLDGPAQPATGTKVGTFVLAFNGVCKMQLSVLGGPLQNLERFSNTDPACRHPAPAGQALQAEPPGIAGGDATLRLLPASLAYAFPQGETATVRVDARLVSPIAEAVNLGLSDSRGVIAQVQLTQRTATHYQAVLKLKNDLAPGTYEGAIRVVLCRDDPTRCASPYAESPWSLPYRFEIRPWQAERVARKLLAAQPGISLFSLPNRSRLSANVAIADNQGRATAWTAESDQPWLRVSAGGTTGTAGSTLTLTADPASLPGNATSYATVRVRSADGSAQADQIRVGLWKGSDNAVAIRTGVTVTTPYKHLVADPVRPYVYAVNGGDTIDVYHVHTGQRISRVAQPATLLDWLAVTPDGSRLLVFDRNVSQVLKFDVGDEPRRSGEWPLAWPPSTVGQDQPLIATARPNGVDILIDGTGTAYRVADGRILRVDIARWPRDPQWSCMIAGSWLAVAGDGTHLLGANKARNCMWVVKMDYSEIDGGTLSVTTPRESGRAFYTGSYKFMEPQIEGSLEGTHFYLANRGGIGYETVDGADLTREVPYPTGVSGSVYSPGISTESYSVGIAVNRTGQVVVLRFDPTESTPAVFTVFNATGSVRSFARAAGITTGAIAASADAAIAIAHRTTGASGGLSLAFVLLPP